MQRDGTHKDAQGKHNSTSPFLSSDNKALSSVLDALAFPRLAIGSLPPSKALPYTDVNSHGLISCPDLSSGAMLRMLSSLLNVHISNVYLVGSHQKTCTPSVIVGVNVQHGI